MEIANRQALVTRKYTLEAVRRRAGMGGYVVTGLRDTPIATSGVLDDLGRPKWDPAEFRTFNADTILCLEVGRRRRWTHGGDRPSPIDPHNWWAGETARWDLVPHHRRAHPRWRRSPGGWRFRAVRCCASTKSHFLPAVAGRPAGAGSNGVHPADCQPARTADLPQSCAATGDHALVAQNRWPVWVYPCRRADSIAL